MSKHQILKERSTGGDFPQQGRHGIDLKSIIDARYRFGSCTQSFQQG